MASETRPISKLPLLKTPVISTSQERFFIVKSKFFKFVVAASLLTLIISGFVFAQRTRTNASSSLLATLPSSDAVALVNVKRVFDEALPKLLADNPAKLAEITAEVAKFKTQTGIDPRSFDQIAFGFNYEYPREGVTKVHSIALAHGTFNPGALVAAGRLASNGKYTEEKYQGKTIYLFSLDRQLKLLGLLDIKVQDLAVTALDGSTLALGDREAVQGAIDAGRTKKHANPALIALATHDPNAIIGFGGNISQALLDNLNLGNAVIARELTAVRQVYGTVGMTATDLEMMVAARTVDVYAARNLSDSFEGFKMLGTFAAGRMSGAKGTLARSAIDNMKVTTSGNELQIRTTVGQSQVAPLISGSR
jgi:hypothetical protein